MRGSLTRRFMICMFCFFVCLFRKTLESFLCCFFFVSFPCTTTILDLPVEEKTADTWEESDDDMPEIPDMDNDPPKTSRNPSASQEDDWVAQFWKMIVSMLFFQWMQQAKERQKLKNEPETAK